ncbi:EVE domain protein [Pelotomaculum sp. FP]|uniref:EVE domain-containing protein n=1 Tax=Pelotomaculum sp. FP TaxID=261474 RepID=UPI001065B016|nr:EVE domain-containing protein [Pelotomaculum sp. FP]TEB12630.1 EVE domain protein [Pelotomaculum sp. FP]
MAYWLMKTEPDEYSYFDLEQAGQDVWDGVKNFAALKNMKNMRPGDLAFIYHTGKEKSVIGIAEVVSAPYPDPSQTNLLNIRIAPKYRLNHPVPLAAIKQDHGFAGWELVRLPRLSVMPVPPEFWMKIHHMAGNPPS